MAILCRNKAAGYAHLWCPLRLALRQTSCERWGVFVCVLCWAKGLKGPLRCHSGMRTASVASLRLDAVLAAMMQVSRAQAVQCIRSGAVAINHMPVQSAHADVFENDVFSVRGYGKYKLCTVGGKSRKGRTIVSYFQY